MDRLDAKAIKTYKEIILILDQCIDDYLFVMDIDRDNYFISPHAMKRFNIPSYEFSDSLPAHKKFVYKDDLEMLLSDMNKMVSGKKSFHNLQYRWIGKDGTPIWINCRSKSIKDENGDVKFIIGCINEIGKRQKADNISGLLREPSLEEYVSSKSKNNITGYFMQIGIDDFEEINGRFGLKCGDEILKQFSRCMQSCINENQKIYELGNGRFIIMDLANHTKEDILELYDELKKSVEVALEESDYRIVYTISVGIVEIDKEMKDYDTLIKYSEFALNEAKKKGKNSCYFFTQDKYKQFIRRREIRVGLQNAVDHNFNNFDVYYQPIIDIHTRNLIGAEALMRFKMKRNEQIEFVSPAEFIPILEESGLIIPTGRWILRQAVACCKKWQEFIPEFKVNVNLSYVQIIKSRILDEIKQALKDYNLKPALLGIEVTESGYLENTYHYKKLWSSLKEEGITLVLDDYGTGYSNAYRLSNLTPHYIKIDRVLTQKALSSNYERSILIYIIEMAHSLKLNVCIEGVETEEELQEIKKLNPDYIQGYLFGKPAPEDEFYNRQIKKK